MWNYLAILLSLVCQILAQFELHFVTPGPATPSPPIPHPGSGGFDPTCVDKLANCKLFGQSSCVGEYAPWAKQNCKNFCKFCIGPTTPAPECKDVLPNCAAYDKASCTNSVYKNWAETKCRRFCRLCPQNVLAVLDTMTTTVPPTSCVDKLECKQYGQSSCKGLYVGWARSNCPNYCGFCKGIPTPPGLCKDKIPNCNRYAKDSCTNPAFKLWAHDNCKMFCGFCNMGPAGPVGPVTPGPLFPTPPPL
ncbi:uncharacterized protein LOC121383059 [Gigantopelta aegis]|uniref:uncharacterized protein LOC121383059 n=1 Tax=Gigantopelta aegis TaxID=1735272 RepID=UPI001B888D10|nr:uncharacterized protein LOC121383059 [Gigantopelta aegis]